MTRRIAVVALLVAIAHGLPAQARTPVELALLLAVDVSASVNYDEFMLQMGGIAAAFRDPSVAAAVRMAGPAGIAVCLLQWSGGTDSVLAVGWEHLRAPDDLQRFAALVDGTGRLPASSGTALGSALRDAIDILQQAPFQARRQVIDVSGDGRANQGVLPEAQRDRASRLGVTVNGLAILNEEPDLDSYYLSSVVTGADSFVIVAADYADFARAMRLKLLREIGGSGISLR